MSPALELPGVSVIETPAEARAHGRRWNRMAGELDTPDAPPEAKEKAHELRTRAKAAHDWARRQEDALVKGARAHDAEAAKVTPIRGGTAEQQHGKLSKERGNSGREGFTSGAAREAGHRAYQAARPPAMRVGRHVFQGASEPFGPIGSGWDLFWESIGVTLGVILLADLLRAPAGIGDVSHAGLGALDRLVGLGDPITGLAQHLGAAPAAASSGAAAGSTHAASTSSGGGIRSFLPAGAAYKAGRQDQGQDFQTTPGGAIVAPGNGYVVAVKSDTSPGGGFGPSYPVVRFTSGPFAGQTVYIGHTISALKTGARFLAGAVLSHTGTSPIGNATVPGWAEIGYASSAGVPGPMGQPVP